MKYCYTMAVSVQLGVTEMCLLTSFLQLNEPNQSWFGIAAQTIWPVKLQIGIDFVVATWYKMSLRELFAFSGHVTKKKTKPLGTRTMR